MAEVKITAELVSESPKFEYEPIKFRNGEAVIDRCVTKRGSVASQKISTAFSNKTIATVTEESDIVPTVYEGGMKVWECAKGLTEFVFRSIAEWKKSGPIKILEVGCGHGLPGIAALMSCHVSEPVDVHFCDYNEEVIKAVTIPNIVRNCGEEKTYKHVRCFYGDWKDLAKQMKSEGLEYDIIMGSDTVYCVQNIPVLLDLVRDVLKKDGGVAFMSGRTYYFGVGGGTRELSMLIDSNYTELEHYQAEHFTRGVERETVGIRYKK